MSPKNDVTYDSREEVPKPPPRDNTEGFLALLAGIGIILLLLQVPSVNVYFKRMLSHSGHPAFNPSTLVWANKDAGVYYCSGSTFYGSGAGTYMRQGNALTSGYQPALGHYCNQDSQANHERPATGAEKLNGKRTSASARAGNVSAQMRHTNTRK